MNEPMSSRWHVTMYSDGKLHAHSVHNTYESGLIQIRRKGLLSGANVLTTSSQCECRGRVK